MTRLQVDTELALREGQFSGSRSSHERVWFYRSTCSRFTSIYVVPSQISAQNGLWSLNPMLALNVITIGLNLELAHVLQMLLGQKALLRREGHEHHNFMFLDYQREKPSKPGTGVGLERHGI